MRGVRDASGLTCYREGVHYLILREKPDALEVVEIFHERMNLEAHLQPLMETTHRSLHTSAIRYSIHLPRHSGK